MGDLEGGQKFGDLHRDRDIGEDVQEGQDLGVLPEGLLAQNSGHHSPQFGESILDHEVIKPVEVLLS